MKSNYASVFTLLLILLGNYNLILAQNQSQKIVSPIVVSQNLYAYPDTDGDGIPDYIDLDDDNDGIPDTVEQAACLSVSVSKSVEVLLLNETFGVGTNRTRINGTNSQVTTSYCYEDGTTAQAADECNTSIDLQDGKYTVHHSISDANGTTQISNSGPDLSSWADQKWYSGLDHTPNDTNGKMAIFNGSFTPGVFYESRVSGIIPNLPINYSFWVLNIDNNDAAFTAAELPRILPNITVRFLSSDANTVLGTFNTGNINRCTAADNTCVLSEWKQFLTTLTVSENEIIVQLINNAAGGSGNDLAIDDIMISQTLCDLDGDGVADIHDLDNDNDGILNIIEAGMVANPDPDKDGTTNGPNWVDANNNGWNDLFEFSGNLPIDTDGDGVPDYLDLDSDNDGLFDVFEYDGKGDSDINGDGAGNGTDIASGFADDEFDGDGILGIMDTNDSDADGLDFGMNGYPDPLDSDGDGIPDYLDVYNDITNVYDASTAFFDNPIAHTNGTINGNLDSDNDGILDNIDTNTAAFGSPRNNTGKYAVYFDGRNDYIEENVNIVSGLSLATMMAWIKLDANFNSEGYIMGQDKFLVKVDNLKKPIIVVNGIEIPLSGLGNSLPTNQWIHVAAVFEGFNNSQTVRMYINGELKDSGSTTSAIQPSVNNVFRIGRNPNNDASGYFKGEIDEVRIFNAALTTEQVQKMVYQELKASNFSMGDVIPLSIPSISPTQLIRYYRMDTFKDDIVDNLVTNTIDIVSGAKLYNIKKIVPQTSPLPYITKADGNWSDKNTWKYGDVWEIDSNIRPWSIVHVQHDLAADFDVLNLGLIIDTNKKLTISNDALIENTWYLKINGKLDLQGLSQLIQTPESVLEPSSAGVLERDQQGVKNKFNYNYWSSPVSTVNTSINNNGYTVASVMKDGTDPNNVLDINWVSGYDGAITTPISVARYWIYKFQNLTNLYANWTQIGETGFLQSGQAYLMKGVGIDNSGATQNYTFVGKPNNGTIINPVAATYVNLSGNPYPSAIDSDTFIRDNIKGKGSRPDSSKSITGTIYFWQHADENTSHYLADYIGGYAALNLTGGVAPVYSAMTAGVGSASRIPNRFIPVGQGFFVHGNDTGGNITFKNTQRAFVLETDDTLNYGSNPIFRSATATVDADTVNVAYKKIRLGFTNSQNYRRQLLLGFMDDQASEDIDAGYDAESIDSNVPSDSYFKVGDSKLIIQGTSYFDENNNYPIGVKTTTNGTIRFEIDSLENFDANQEFYIHDNQTDIYYDISDNPADITVETGVYDTRFTLRFTNQTLSQPDSELLASYFNVYFDNQQHIVIKNNEANNAIEKITVFSILGQQMHVENGGKTDVKINTSSFATGTYIVQIATANGSISKKVLIN